MAFLYFCQLLSFFNRKDSNKVVGLLALNFELSSFDAGLLPHYREKANVGNIRIQKHKSNVPSTSTPVNVLLGESINASDIKLVCFHLYNLLFSFKRHFCIYCNGL